MMITQTTECGPVGPAPLVVNRVAECHAVNANNRRVLPFGSLAYAVFHRADLDRLDPVANPYPIQNEDLDGPGLACSFLNAGLGTGGCIPYTFLLRANPGVWTLEQLLPLSICGAHAIGYNARSIGIATVGDFRKAPPAAGQYDKLVQLATLLLPINGGLDPVGHTDLPDASADPNKVCPGAFLPVKVIAASALAALPTNWKMWSRDEVTSRLLAAGITL
jgi:hypothetical protein